MDHIAFHVMTRAGRPSACIIPMAGDSFDRRYVAGSMLVGSMLVGFMLARFMWIGSMLTGSC